MDENSSSLPQNILQDFESQLDRPSVELGKTRYYFDVYSQTHEWVPTRRILETENLSLHRIIQRVVKLLKAGRSVCVDDTNQVERTRASYIQAVSREIPAANLKVVMFEPTGGINQIRYTSEWASAYWQLKDFYRSSELEFPEHSIDLGEETYKPPTSYLLDQFENHPQPVHPNVEGFSQVEYISSQIYSLCEPFHRAALFVEAHSIFNFQHVSGDQFQVTTTFPLEAMRAVFTDWLMRTRDLNQLESDPRLILLVDERLLFPAALESDAVDPERLADRISAHRDELKEAIKGLGLSYPVYFITAQYGGFDDRNYFSLPNAGMIAWAQHRHRLALGSCIYVKNIEKSVQNVHLTVRVPAGLSFISASDFFAVTGYDSHSKISKKSIVCKSTTLPFLQNIKFLNYLPEPPKPLEPSAADLAESPDFILQEESVGFGRAHGVCWPSDNYVAPVPAVVVPQLNSSQPPPAPASVAPSLKAETPSKKRSLPSWMTTQATPAPDPLQAGSTVESPSPARKRRKIAETDNEAQNGLNQLQFTEVKNDREERAAPHQSSSPPPVAASAFSASPASSQSRSQPKSVPPRLVHAAFFSQEDDDDAWISATTIAAAPPPPPVHPIHHESQSLQFMSQPGSQNSSIQIEEEDDHNAAPPKVVQQADGADVEIISGSHDDAPNLKQPSRANTQDFDDSDDDVFAQVARENSGPNDS